MNASTEDAIKLQKFRLMSFLVQRLESGNIELAQQALNGIEGYAEKALRWFEALSQESKSKLKGLEKKLEEIKEKVNQWREILTDIWKNKGKLGQVINELVEESNSISEFPQTIDGLTKRIAAKVQESQEEKRQELVMELNRLYNLKDKVEGLKTSLIVAKRWFEDIKWEIRAKKKGR
jgi:uncharacterized protein YoxC